MICIAPSERDTETAELEKRLWAAMDRFRAGLKSQEYSAPFLGLIFLRLHVSRFAPVKAFDCAMTYCMYREPEMRVKLEQLSNGVAQQNLSPVLASKVEFARPPRELRQRFADLAEPMVRRMVQIHSTIQNRRRTRDLLLTRLLSGQVHPKRTER